MDGLFTHTIMFLWVVAVFMLLFFIFFLLLLFWVVVGRLLELLNLLPCDKKKKLLPFLSPFFFYLICFLVAFYMLKLGSALYGQLIYMFLAWLKTSFARSTHQDFEVTGIISEHNRVQLYISWSGFVCAKQWLYCVSLYPFSHQLAYICGCDPKIIFCDACALIFILFPLLKER